MTYRILVAVAALAGWTELSLASPATDAVRDAIDAALRNPTGAEAVLAEHFDSDLFLSAYGVRIHEMTASDMTTLRRKARALALLVLTETPRTNTIQQGELDMAEHLPSYNDYVCATFYQVNIRRVKAGLVAKRALLELKRAVLAARIASLRGQPLPNGGGALPMADLPPETKQIWAGVTELDLAGISAGEFDAAMARIDRDKLRADATAKRHQALQKTKDRCTGTMYVWRDLARDTTGVIAMVLDLDGEAILVVMEAPQSGLELRAMLDRVGKSDGSAEALEAIFDAENFR